MKEAAQKYRTLDPESEEGRGQLATLFTGQSADDIQRKLRKIEGADASALENCWSGLRRFIEIGIGSRKKRGLPH